MKAVVATFNQEKALVGAFSVITNLRMQFGCNFLKHYNQGKGRIKQLPQDEAEVHVGGHMNGLGPGLGSPSGLDTKPMQTSAATRFKMEGGGGGGGTPACVKAEAEPMEGVEAGDSSDSQSLNTCGPQEQVSSAREHHTVLYCTVLYCTVLYCAVLYR